MSKGVLLFAHNNASVDYVKQAVYCAKKIKEHLKLPVALVTSNGKYLKETFSYYEKYIDHVIDVPWYECKQIRVFRDGTMSNRELEWRNHDRHSCYDLTPFDETIVMDTDFIIGNSILLNAFNTEEDFLIYRNITDINMDRPDEYRFNKISDKSIDMYWATVFYFKKTEFTKFFFGLIEHIRENWNFYRLIHQIPNKYYRNDYAFSIAIHMLNGFQRTSWPKHMPGKLWFTSDNDVLIKLENDSFTFLMDKKNWTGHYYLSTIDKANVHVLNKFSLERQISKVLDNE